MNEFELNSKSITELVFTIFGSNESNDDEEYWYNDHKKDNQ